MPLPVIAAMAGLGLAKGILDRKKEEAERRQAAEMARYSPWTGMQPNQIHQADMLGSTMQGGMAGAMMGGGNLDFGGGGEAAGAMPTPDPAAAGGQSMATMTPEGQYPGATTYNQEMMRKYPWLGTN